MSRSLSLLFLVMLASPNSVFLGFLQLPSQSPVTNPYTQTHHTHPTHMQPTHTPYLPTHDIHTAQHTYYTQSNTQIYKHHKQCTIKTFKDTPYNDITHKHTNAHHPYKIIRQYINTYHNTNKCTTQTTC